MTDRQGCSRLRSADPRPEGDHRALRGRFPRHPENRDSKARDARPVRRRPVLRTGCRRLPCAFAAAYRALPTMPVVRFGPRRSSRDRHREAVGRRYADACYRIATRLPRAARHAGTIVPSRCARPGSRALPGYARSRARSAACGGRSYGRSPHPAARRTRDGTAGWQRSCGARHRTEPPRWIADRASTAALRGRHGTRAPVPPSPRYRPRIQQFPRPSAADRSRGWSGGNGRWSRSRSARSAGAGRPLVERPALPCAR